MNMESIDTQESREEDLSKSAPEIEEKIIKPEKFKTSRAKMIAFGLAALTLQACGGVDIRISQGAGPYGGRPQGTKQESVMERRPRPPAEYCDEIDRALASPYIRDYQKEIRTPQGLFILRGMEVTGGKYMTITFIPPSGKAQRIDCKPWY